MKIVFKFELDVEVTDKTLEHLMLNDETKKMTLGIFKEKMLEDLSKAISQMPHSTIRVNEVLVKE